MKTLLQKHAAEALINCSQTSWEPNPIYDHDEQRHSQATIENQLGGFVGEAEPLVKIIISGWCLSGKMPRSQGPAVYFTRLALQSASMSDWLVRPGDLPETGPPWTVKQTAKFISMAIDPWFRLEWKNWAHTVANEAFSVQESIREIHHRRE